MNIAIKFLKPFSRFTLSIVVKLLLIIGISLSAGAAFSLASSLEYWIVNAVLLAFGVALTALSVFAHKRLAL